VDLGAPMHAKWVYSCHKRVHTHDIKTLCCVGDTLVSGGVDTTVRAYQCSQFADAAPEKLSPYPTNNFISTSNRLLLYHQAQTLQLFQLAEGPAAPPDQLVAGAIIATGGEENLLELHISDSSEILCSAISPCGGWIACGTANKLRLFRLESRQVAGQMVLDAVHEVADGAAPEGTRGAVMMRFVPNQNLLVIATPDNGVQVVDVGEHKLRHSFGNERHKGNIRSLSLSADGQWAAVGDSTNAIHVYNMDTAALHHQLPVLGSAHSTVQFHPHGPSAVLVVVSWSGSFYLYDVEERKLQDYTVDGFTRVLPKSGYPHLSANPETFGVAFNPQKPDVIIFYSHNMFCQVDLRKPRELPTREPQASTKKEHKSKKHKKDNKKSKETGVQVVEQFKPILYVGFTDDGSLVVVERPWLQVMETLPSVLHRARYGAA